MALAALAWCAGVSPVLAGPVRANGEVCVTNAFKVAWVHPDITFYLDGGAGGCVGERLTLKEGEEGCFKTAPVPYDSSRILSAEDATTAACLAVCDIERAHIRIVFDQSKVYACGE